MTLLARASPVVRQSLARSSARTPVRFSHGHAYTPADAVPFNFQSKTTFGSKVAVYLLSGFSVPFFATWYQLKKSGAGGA